MCTSWGHGRKHESPCRENPCRNGEDVNTPHIQWTCSGISFSHQHYNQTMLNETTLFKDLL